MDTYKQICAKLVEAWDDTADGEYEDFGRAASYLVDWTRAALAEPDPEITHDGSSNKPTAKELQSLWQACNSPSVFARAVLARWGHPAPTLQPRPVDAHPT